jgi:hypothetical protein
VSLYDYQQSKELAKLDAPFYALLMAAMRQADTFNAEKLKREWPAAWAEMDARYNAPGGQLESDRLHEQKGSE